MITLLLLLILVLLIALPALIKDQQEMVGMCRVGLVALALVLMVVRWAAAPATHLDDVELSESRNWAVGWAIGQALTERFPDGGKLAVFVPDGSREAIVQMRASLLKGLEDGSKAAGFDLQVLQPNTLSEDAFSDRPDAGAMEPLVAQTQDAVAIVSFIQFPFNRLKSVSLPPVFVWDQYGSGYWKGWMKRGLVAGAVAPHGDHVAAHNAELQRGSPEEQFRSVYALITPGTMSETQ